MTILLALAVALLALVAVLVAVLLIRRSAHRADDKVASLVETLNSRIDDLARELAGAREQAEDELRRNRVLGDLGGTIDLDEVLARTLEAATQITGAEAALAWLPDPGGGPPLVATFGLSQDEAERQAVAGPPDGRHARAVSFNYRYSTDELDRDGELIRAGLSVPMGDAEANGGYLAVFSRTQGEFDDEAVDELEQLAQRAAPAIDNARRFREARQLADLDALTGLHNRRYFHETLAREVARAHRYNRSLALIVFDLDDFKAINDRIGHLAGDSVLADAAARVREVVRSADIACRVGGDEFGVILPESSMTDADQLYRRIQHSVSTQPAGSVGRVGFSAGVAELRPNDDAVSFFQRADEALYRAKEAGKGQISSASNAG
jgi:two-component system cell cycle response regulator